MKCTVWTRADYTKSNSAKPKCVFAGSISCIPPKEAGVTVRDGFWVESIDHIYYTLYNDTLEIGLTTTDQENEYPEVDYNTGKDK